MFNFFESKKKLFKLEVTTNSVLFTSGEWFFFFVRRCKAPIASLDCMADLGSTTEQLCAKLQAVAAKESAERASSATQSPSLTSGLRYRNLGKSGLRVSNIGLATWTTFNTTISEEQLEAVVTAAYNAGINLFDLTEGPQNSEQAETQLGAILKRKNWKRVSYSVITKIHWHYKYA